MKLSNALSPARDSILKKWPAAAGLAIALACLLATPPLHAQGHRQGGQNHGQNRGQRHVQRQPVRQIHRQDNRRRGNYYQGYPGYVYGAPPIIYGPQAAPGINLFLPLR
ncbi:MAG TPA: hypothetical protein VGC69_19110 [Bordetella sp.]